MYLLLLWIMNVKRKVIMKTRMKIKQFINYKYHYRGMEFIN